MTAAPATITSSMNDQSLSEVEIDISSLHCAGSRTIRFKLSRKQLLQLSPSMQSKYSRGTKRSIKCKAVAVYMVLPDKLPMCNQHFNEYFETHEIEAEMVMRLSDDEDDFGNAAHNYPKKRKKSRTTGDPICQVPRPKLRSESGR